MNERMKELAEQAGLLYPQFGPTVDTRHQRKKRENIEKFAELIVRECSQYIEDKFDFCGDEIIIAEKLLEHFGVEE